MLAGLLAHLSTDAAVEEQKARSQRAEHSGAEGGWQAADKSETAPRAQGIGARHALLGRIGCARWFTGELARAHVPMRIGMGRANSVLSQVKAVVVPCNVQPFRLPLSQ